ncbi:MAG: nucleotidyltransferase domain-containing protein [Elusimicrobiota bacterium]
MTNKEAEKWAIAETRRITRFVLKGLNVRTWLFGSRATGTARSFSDIDIALDAGGNPVPRNLLVRLSCALEESHIPFRVDIVDIHSVNPAVRENIIREGQLWID